MGDGFGDLLPLVGGDPERAGALVALPLVHVASVVGGDDPSLRWHVAVIAEAHLTQPERQVVEAWLREPPEWTTALCAAVARLAGSEEGAGLGVTIERLRQIVDEAARLGNTSRSERASAKALVGWSEALDAVSDAQWEDPTETTHEISKLWRSRENAGEPIERPADLATGAWALLAVHGGPSPQWFTLTKDRVVVGRGAEADVRISWDSQISRRHLLIERTAEGAVLHDLGSTNGVGDVLGRAHDHVRFALGLTELELELLATPRPPAKQPDPGGRELTALLADAVRSHGPEDGELDLDAVPEAQRILSASRDVRAEAVVAAMTSLVGGTGGIRLWGAVSEGEAQAFLQLTARLLRAKLPFDEPRLHALLGAVPAIPRDSAVPSKSIVALVERYVETSPLSHDLLHDLDRMIEWLQSDGSNDGALLAERLAATKRLGGDGPFPLAFDAWGRAVQLWYAGLDREQRKRWAELASHARAVGASLRPSARWRAEARDRVQAVGKVDFIQALGRWLREVEPGPALDSRNRDAIKGMIVVGGALGGRKIAKDLRDFAVLCYEPVDGKRGPQRSRVLGNACVVALGDMDPGVREPALAFLMEHVAGTQSRSFVERTLRSQPPDED
jgi:hypothetical protein